MNDQDRYFWRTRQQWSGHKIATPDRFGAAEDFQAAR
jgi:hypothetical protein